MNILITGGAGYKGCILTEELLKLGHSVTVLDNFMYGNHLIGHTPNPKFNVLNKDIRNVSADDVKDADVIYHLAGLSGYAACEANPHSSAMVNEHSCRKLIKLLGKGQKLIYASTTSLYGRSGKLIDETAATSPISIYGKTKLAGERICLEHSNSLSLRFATIFGCAPRMRADLMLNDFVRNAVQEKALILFDANSQRTFLHVRDAIKGYIELWECEGIYNVGDNDLNYSKQQVADLIKKRVDYDIINSEMEDFDKRHYIVDYSKAKGFKADYTLESGIDELVKLYSFYRPFQHHATI